ncbi:MAG TPA: bifunctional phosphopantothenoylcysteine decarboxylase/phosphopantothenate--cysteine ligase CoaBC [Frankiaceae bacterium]|jgi:phosphopantothenoylcysteine decarboxylase/phosphopantothenate--cysteine ligase|nr:bifunctional phosphopantothenoylcysteine decarboxylase/phosphopantothenate--cysteine ligase CoaBC [Frankiaceae bacterium]
MARVVLGVSGGIAAYKAVEVLRRLTEAGHSVRVVPTRSALKFVGAPTWEALSGEPVTYKVFENVPEVPHVRLGQTADLVLVAPATADLLSRAATGRADDLLTGTLLTARCPVVYAPAMHTEMWEHPATVANVATLRSRGAVVIDPDVGPLAKGDVGPGRLPSPEAIVAAALAALDGATRGADLAGRRVVVSAGGTREYLDPVRFLGNRSSGRQGYALARTAAARGAEVTLVSANAALPDPAGVKVVRVVSADDLRTAVLEAAAEADAVVMAAAVADFRPAERSATKVKKTETDPPPVALVRNPDVLAELSASRRQGQVVVGFAAETDDVLANGRAKLARKGCDLLVVNEVGEGLAFEVEDNAAVVLGADGSETEVPRGSKESVAHAVWDLVAARLTS